MKLNFINFLRCNLTWEEIQLKSMERFLLSQHSCCYYIWLSAYREMGSWKQRPDLRCNRLNPELKRRNPIKSWEDNSSAPLGVEFLDYCLKCAGKGQILVLNWKDWLGHSLLWIHVLPQNNRIGKGLGCRARVRVRVAMFLVGVFPLPLSCFSSNCLKNHLFVIPLKQRFPTLLTFRCGDFNFRNMCLPAGEFWELRFPQIDKGSEGFPLGALFPS